MNSELISRENAFERLEKLKQKYGNKAENIAEANEAETRVVLIDEILKILGWQPDEFKPEARSGKNFIDYLLTADGIPRVVVEAKRLGKTFGFPSHQMHETSYKVSYFRSAYGRSLNAVLEQATNYSYEKKISFAVITNGVEWFIMPVIAPPGKRKEDLKGFYFGNLFSDYSNFELLWEILSKRAILEGYLEERIFELNANSASDSLFISSHFDSIDWKPPTSEDLIREFYYYFFTEITDSRRRKMLEMCFTEDASIRQYQSELKRALKDASPNYLPPETSDASPGEGKSLLLGETGDISGRVILVVGSVGCGKSTLITKVIVESKRQRAKDLIVIKVDLIDEVGKIEQDVSAVIWSYILEQWKEVQPGSTQKKNLKSYFKKEIDELKIGPKEDLFKLDKKEYIREEARLLQNLCDDHITFFSRCWRYYKSQNQGIILVIDNVDQASEDFQEKVYGFAHKIAKRTGATVIITLREFTFFRAKEDGFLDVRAEDTVIHLQSPNLEQLLSKRIKYVEKYISEDFRVSEWRKAGILEALQEKSKQHAAILKKSFLSSDNSRNLLGLLASISWHNVRTFLEFLRRLHMQFGSSANAWSDKELVAALMTGCNFDKSASVIPNIFRPSYPNYHCYFLKIRVILMLIYGLKSRDLRRGIKISNILSFSRLYGYQSSWTKRAVEELVREQLLECLEVPVTIDYTKDYKIHATHSYRASPLAVKLVQEIVKESIYLSFIGCDLPFHKTAFFETYKNSLRSIIDTLDHEKIEREAIDLIAESNLGVIVASYLVDVFEEEASPVNYIRNVPEVSIVESKLSEIIEEWGKLIDSARDKMDWGEVAPEDVGRDVKGKTVRNNKNKELLDNYFLQPNLFEELSKDLVQTDSAASCLDVSIENTPEKPEGVEVKEIGEATQEELVPRSIANKIPIPEDIFKIRICRSEQAALIFWALTALTASGRSFNSGVEITKVINTYLVDDHHTKFPNNISRALRSSTLRSQEWLAIKKDDKARGNLFGLGKEWRRCWEEIFHMDAPVIEEE